MEYRLKGNPISKARIIILYVTFIMMIITYFSHGVTIPSIFLAILFFILSLVTWSGYKKSIKKIVVRENRLQFYRNTNDSHFLELENNNFYCQESFFKLKFTKFSYSSQYWIKKKNWDSGLIATIKSYAKEDKIPVEDNPTIERVSNSHTNGSLIFELIKYLFG